MVGRGPEPHPRQSDSDWRPRGRAPGARQHVDPFLSEAVMKRNTTMTIIGSFAELGTHCVRHTERRPALLGSLAAAIVVFLLLPATLHSQSMDYGALEQLFKEPVTTSVNGSPERVSEVPAYMEIITADEIRRS